MTTTPLQSRPNFISIHDGVHAIVQKPVKDPENIFGQALRADMRNKDYDQDEKMRRSEYKKKNRDTDYDGQLPFATSPRMYGNPDRDRMIPESNTFSRVCFNDNLEKTGPFYLRHWQIWDNAPFRPTIGDVTKDPRYGQQTKSFTTEYKKLI